MVSRIGEVANARQLQLEREKAVGSSTSFGDILQNELNKSNGVQFSKHAAERISQRGVEVTDTLLNGLNQAVEKARSKGAKDVVVIGGQGAFIVNVPNNVVITAMAGNEMKDNIFTNIDSAVLL